MSGSPDIVLAVLHWVEYLGLLGAIGSMVVRRVARQGPRIQWADPPMHLALGIAFAGGLALTLVESIESGALPGWAPIGRVAAEGLAWYLCGRGIPFVAPVAVLAAGLLPFAGHAAQFGPGAELADALHVLSAGMWAGGILALATLRPPKGWRGVEARVLVDRFSGVALVAFAITALTGLLRATDQLHDVSDLWSTSYGIVLALKSAGVGIMLVLSSLAWRRGLPVARLEAATMVLVVAATAVLAAFPAQA
ncbi:MAG: CopD family protein [Candidatus Dormiibacterota bacterium]